MKRIDAHQHFWEIKRGDYGWITPAQNVLYRNFFPEHLIEHLDKHELEGSIVVQAAATAAETHYILDLALKNDRIIGVVGWLDLYDPQYKENLDEIMAHPKFLGIRIMIQEMTDCNEVLKSPVLDVIRYLAEIKIPVDLLVRSDQLYSVVKLLELVPDLHCVIDHIAKPAILEKKLEPWMSQITLIAANPNVYCKVSGLVTEADHLNWHYEDFQLYVSHALESFGPNRVLFGSDWPVCLLAASYDEVIQVLENSIPKNWTVENKQRLFGENAMKFYKLKEFGEETEVIL